MFEPTSAVAAENADCTVDTLNTLQPARFRLKDAASLNIWRISLTDAVFQPPMFSLNAAVEENIEYMLMTDAVFHELMFWLKVFAL